MQGAHLLSAMPGLLRRHGKTITGAVGSVLAVLAIGFIVLSFRKYDAVLDFSTVRTGQWWALVGLAATYGLATALLGAGWWQCLGHLGLAVVPQWACSVYGATQLSKYVPGNIFHLAGRQALGMMAGLPGWRLAKSAVLETVLLCMAGALLGCLALARLEPALGTGFAVSAYLLGAALVLLVLRRWQGGRLAWAFALYSLFLLISGLVFQGVLRVLGYGTDWASANVVLVVGAYVLAWLIGMVTPGAPAGIGIREMVLFFFLKTTLTETDVIVAVVAGRVVTVSGDVLAFVVASLWRLKLRQPGRAS